MEFPFKAGLREICEETGLDVAIVSKPVGEESETVEPIPRPEAIQLVNINMYNGAVGLGYCPLCGQYIVY